MMTYKGGGMSMERGPTGAYLVPCQFCRAVVTVFDGQRVYEPDGFPYIHLCPPPAVRPLNERDLTPAPIPAKKANKPVQASIQAVPGDLGGVPL